MGPTCLGSRAAAALRRWVRPRPRGGVCPATPPSLATPPGRAGALAARVADGALNPYGGGGGGGGSRGPGRDRCPRLDRTRAAGAPGRPLPGMAAEVRVSRWYFGGLASCGAACCTHPLDLLKVRAVWAGRAAVGNRGPAPTKDALAPGP